MRELARYRCGKAAFLFAGVLGAYALSGGAWFFAGACLGYLACMWVVFADPDYAASPRKDDTNA